MKILSSRQIREADSYTIKNEPISSLALMERASLRCVEWFKKNIPGNPVFHIFVGPGNNGGDGLAIARLLSDEKYQVKVYFIDFSDTLSSDCQSNLDKLSVQRIVPISILNRTDQFPLIHGGNDLIIDTLFGSGLNRPLSGFPADLVEWINHLNNKIIAIDIPSGLFGEDNSGNTGAIMKADITLTFQSPLLSFFLQEHERNVGDWKILDIGLDPGFLSKAKVNFEMVDTDMVQHLIKPRKKFSHKGTYGHALLVAGSYGKMGAAVLASKSCLRTGVGLLSVATKKEGHTILQCSVPEAMVWTSGSNFFPEKSDLANFSAIGLGPGLGTGDEALHVVSKILQVVGVPLVLDADALNIISGNKKLLKKLPKGTILTPHPKEFERLAGKSDSHFQRIQQQTELSKRLEIYIVLKGAYTSISFPDGHVYFNSTGNPGMATAGSGDVLTGILLSLLAQGYSPQETCLSGVFLHGLAGDIAASESDENSLIAGDIVNSLGKAFRKLILVH